MYIYIYIYIPRLAQQPPEGREELEAPDAHQGLVLRLRICRYINMYIYIYI